MGQVDKVVIPAAGLGTRFLPATKAQPKEMLPVVDKPAIQYVIEEAIRNNLTNILVITGRGKRSIEDHFDRSLELETLLASRGKNEELALVQRIASLGNLHYLRQGDPKGLGHAVLTAKQHIGSEPFVTMLADDIMADDSPLLAKMLNTFSQVSSSILSLMPVPIDQISLYGCAEVRPVGDGLVEVVSVVEKPQPQDAPSNLAITGRYLFTPTIFSALASTPPGFGGEIQLTDGIQRLLAREKVFGIIFEEGRYDIGDKLGYLRAVVELALARSDIGPRFQADLHSILERNSLATTNP
ncbi:MAG: UTP--glucose-1-phosphate uridylyltransferase GalU [Ferrimicrobium sp.]